MAITDIVKVLYEPHKAFKSVVQNPKFLVPLLVLIIFLAVQVGSQYVVASKSFIEQTKPTADQTDTWAGNATLWQTNEGVAVTVNNVDFINATYYFNNTSLEFSSENSSSLQAALMSLDGSVNCGSEGFKALSVRIKFVSPSTKPVNATLYLYSSSDSNFFSYDLAQVLSNSIVNVWNNLTLPVGSGNWASSGTPNWESITSLKLDFGWASTSSIDMRVAGLFFRGTYQTPLDVYGSAYLFSIALNAITPFLFQWLLLTGLMWVMIKGLKGVAVWKPLMVAVGLALVTLIVQAVILAVVYATMLPNVYYPLEVLVNVQGEYAVAYQAILDSVQQVTLIGGAVQIAIYVWTIGLAAFVTRAMTATAASPAVPVGEELPLPSPLPGPQQFRWTKCLLVAAASFLLTVLILGFFFGG